ncbi:hypothetical protein CRG86_004650 [Photobacterium leiognathi]|nr:hypothetical protein CRG86_004650 [Photobacterium leiognathi]
MKHIYLKLKNALLLQRESINIYIFGSALYSNFPNDIDVLIVYSDLNELPTIKHQLFQISLEYPLDIYYMTPEEVNELDFINVTQAVELSSLTKAG